MGVRQRLAATAVRRPHVLVVPVPGSRPVRWAAEEALDGYGWSRAGSPADADVLLCCGVPGPELAPHVDVAWDGMPGPRTRVTATTPEQVASALQSAVAQLGDVRAQRGDAQSRPSPRQSAADGDSGVGGGADKDAPMDMSGMDHSMDMDMGMDLPGGLVMADRMEDRDGLRLEGLHLSLGPLLPGWPVGLRLDAGLSGDVLTAAEVVRLDPQPEPDASPMALAFDALAVLLDAAGWKDGAVRARRARAGGGTGPVAADLLRRLDRARLLRWSLVGLPAPDGADLVAHLGRLVDAARGQAPLPAGDDDRLARDVVGLDLGTAALVVAAHGPLQRVGVRA